MRDLGEHRLKDLQERERVFQLVHPDLPAEVGLGIGPTMRRRVPRR